MTSKFDDDSDGGGGYDDDETFEVHNTASIDMTTPATASTTVKPRAVVRLATAQPTDNDDNDDASGGDDYGADFDELSYVSPKSSSKHTTAAATSAVAVP